jgi:hypothetical protein
MLEDVFGLASIAVDAVRGVGVNWRKRARNRIRQGASDWWKEEKNRSIVYGDVFHENTLT